MRKLNYTLNKDNWFVADFETLTTNTDAFKKHNDVFVILAALQKFNKPDSPVELFSTIDEFFNYIFSLKRSATIFFHNLSFDGDFIIKYLVNKTKFSLNSFENNPLRKSFTVFKSGGSIYSIKLFYYVKRKNVIAPVNIIFKCSYKLLNASISSLGKDLNINKYLGITDTTTFYDVEPQTDINKYDSLYIEYCKRDVIILNLALTNFEKSINSAKSVKAYNKRHPSKFNIFNSLTAGSIATDLIKKIYLPQYNRSTMRNIDLLTTADTYHFCKPFLQGGFTQFSDKYIGEPIPVNNGHFYDVKSAYPYQMTKALPYGSILYAEPKSPHVTFYILEIEHAKIKPECYNFVCMKNWKPHESRGRYTRELSNFTAFYIKEEWEILNKFYDFKIKEKSTFYMLKADYLKEYITDLYFYKDFYKKQGQPSLAHGFKILLNSSYGKLCTRAKFNAFIFSKDNYEKEQIIDVMGVDHEVLLNSTINPYGDYSTYIMRPIPDKLFLSNIAAASYITALQRSYLFETVYNVGCDKFIYSDTDSIAFENPDKTKIKIGSALGDWELEKTFNYFGTYGAKKYKVLQDDKITKLALSGIRLLNFRDKNNPLKWDLEKFKKINFNLDSIDLQNAVLIKKYLPSGTALILLNKLFKKGGL